MQEGKERVVVYGADWCGITINTLRHLDEIGVSYSYIDVDQDEASSRWVKDQNKGEEVKPTLDIEGEVLSAPRNYMLDDALKRHGILA
ncbi:MAG: glutaredoxin family protein [Chloroflexota bacterium]|nr:glutaredoxin family protein [Chloroflexota bacterium]